MTTRNQELELNNSYEIKTTFNKDGVRQQRIVTVEVKESQDKEPTLLLNITWLAHSITLDTRIKSKDKKYVSIDEFIDICDPLEIAELNVRWYKRIV